MQIIFSNPSALNGLFASHQIKTVNGHTKMRPYSQASYAINPEPNNEIKNVERENLVIISFAKEVTVVSFVIVPYLFSSSSSVELLAIRKLVAAVTNVKENDIEIEYGSAISKKKIKFIGNDKDLIQQIQF